jgi:hypothetical protein
MSMPAAWQPWRLGAFYAAYFAAGGVLAPYFPLYLDARGLTAAEIGIEARIARDADAFDAITSTRPYRRALTVSAARAELRRHAGTQFCPIVVAALERQLERRALDHALEAARDPEFVDEAKTA